jgi:hypothetical protein
VRTFEAVAFGLTGVAVAFRLVRLGRQHPAAGTGREPDAESTSRVDERGTPLSRDAEPADWPRHAAVGLVLISLAAAGAAIGLVLAASDRSAAAGAAAAASALLGASSSGLIVAAVRRAYRAGRWTRPAAERTALLSVLIGLALCGTAYFGGGTVGLVALAAFAGFTGGAFAGSLLWQRSVLRAHRRQDPTI